LAAVASNRKAAQKIHDQRRQQIIEERRDPRPEEKPFAEAAGEFARWCETTEYRAKHNSAKRIKTSLASAVAHFGQQAVSGITAGDVEAYKAFRIGEHGVRDVTLRHDLHALSLFFKFARKHRWLATDPLDGVKIPSDVDAVRIYVLSAEEEAAYFEKAARNRNLYDVHRLLILQGCRPEEIMDLRQEHVDLGGGTVFIAGGKSRAARRTLSLCGESIDILAARLQKPGKWVFPSSRKPGYHLTKLNGAHDAACRAAGVSFVPYDLRHTFATRLAQSGCDLASLAAILGHSSLRMVMKYVHPTAQHQKEAMKKFEASLKPRLKVVG
jgi:integrase